MSIENFNYQFCVECGNPDIREPFNDGHKQCNDKSCLQEFFDDVDYGDILVFPSDYVKKLSSELATTNAEIEKLKKALEIAREKFGFYADIKSWGFVNQDESHKTWVVINESDTEIHVNKKLPEEIYDLGGKRARIALKEIEEVLNE